MKRNIRLRKEYIYRKSFETKDAEQYKKKMVVREVLEGKKRMPTELRKDAEKLKNEIDLEDKRTEVPQSLSVDDEYSQAGLRDPKVCIVTSRDPSTRLKQFAKEVRMIIPNSQIINRGSYQVEEIMDACRKNEFTDVIVLMEQAGDPSSLIVSHLPYGPTCYFTICNAVLRHDIEGVTSASEAYPHLLFHNMNSKLGLRVTNILKYLFPVPKQESQRTITFASNGHHNFKKVGYKNIQLSEIGPRFELKPYQIKLGTIEMKEADTEWVYRPHRSKSKVLMEE